jgi:hypothetical protein
LKAAMTTWYPIYEVLPLEDGGGWYAIITPRKGPPNAVYGFLSEIEAWGWLRKDRMASQAQLGLFRTG